MIKLIENKGDFYCDGKNPLSVKIGGLFSAYGAGFSFAMFWRQTDDFERQTALLSLFDGNMTVSAEDSADFEELKEFIAAMNPETIFCSRHVCESLEFHCIKEVCVYIRKTDYSVAVVPMEQEGFDYRRLYTVLQGDTEGNIQLPPFESWYADLSHRIRHGAARVSVILKAGNMVAAAVSAFETENSAIISGIAVVPEVRRNGIGRQILHKICTSFNTEKENIYVFTDRSATGFYEKSGFTDYDRAVYCKL